MANPLQTLADLANAQGDAHIDLGAIPWTAARPQTHKLFSAFMLGRNMRDPRYISATANKVVTNFNPEVHSTGFGPVKLASDFTRGSTSSQFEMSTPLVPYRWQTEITTYQIGLQGRGPFTNGSQKFWDILEKREQDFAMDPVNKMEAELGREPSLEMFDDQGTGLQPIKSFVTGVNLWEPRHGVPAEGLFPGMTDQQGLDPNDPRFKRVDKYGVDYGNTYLTTGLGGPGFASQLAPTKMYYEVAGRKGVDANGDIDPNAGPHFFERFRNFKERLGWPAVPWVDSFTTENGMGPRGYYCSQAAINLIERTSRAHDNFYATVKPAGDANKLTMVNGMPMIVCDTIASGKYYPNIGDGSAGASGLLGAVDRDPVAEDDPAGIRGAYIYALNPASCQMYFWEGEPWRTFPWTTLMPNNAKVMFRWGEFLGNMHFSEFATNGILAPSVDQGTGYGEV